MSDPQRITCIVNSLSPGGAERAMNWLATALSPDYRVTLLTLAPADQDFYEMGARVARCVAPPSISASCRWFDLPGFRRRLAVLRDTILATRPDLVISFVDTLNIQVLLALYFRRVPVIVSERVYPPSYHLGRHWNLLRRVAYPRAQAVVVQTGMTAQWARSCWPRWHVQEIPNAVPPATQDAPQRPSWFGRRNLVSMGRLTPQKNFPLLIRAFAALAARFGEWHLTIVGDGPQREQLLALVQSLDLGERIHLPGRIRAPWSSLQQADLFVMTSDFEGFPNALAEAMAHGLPVVSTDCPTGPADIVRDRVDGLLVGPGDQAALTDALATLMADDAARARLAARAPEVCGRFSEARVAAEWGRLIGGFLHGSG